MVILGIDCEFPTFSSSANLTIIPDLTFYVLVFLINRKQGKKNIEGIISLKIALMVSRGIELGFFASFATGYLVLFGSI